MGVPLQFRVSGTGVEVRGPGNNLPTTPPTPFFANVIAADINAVNGVIHVVNQVLLPQ
jgi:uncharacterized surface protein with fasciclin (FAS1) repeats